MNNYTAALGVGIYHCGIEVHGVGKFILKSF